MDPALRLVVDCIEIAVLLGIPGASLLLLLRRPPTDLTRALVYTLCLSILYDIVAALALLQLGAFSTRALVMIGAVPLVVAIVRFRSSMRALRRIQFDRSTFAPAALVGAAVVVILLATPHWNFLIAPNMDAGNYEVYGNHFWTTGSFYLDASELLDAGADPEWIESHNTWNVHLDTGLARPSYLPGYPVLLGVFKSGFESAVASPAVNAVLAGASAMLLVLIGLQLVKSPFAIGALALAMFMTPMLFFYGKQLMSEQLGVLGVLVMVHAVLESRGMTASDREGPSPSIAAVGLATGLGIGLVSRLDLYLLVPLLVVGLGLSAIDEWRDDERRLSASFYVWPAFAIVFGSLLVALLGEDSYLRLGQPEFLSGMDPQVFIVLYGVGNGLALLAMLGLRPLLDRLGGRTREVMKSRLVPGGYAVFASAWLLFLLWAGIVRPLFPEPSGPTHDVHNLIRLFGVSSPVLLGVALLWSPVALLVRRKERGIASALILGLGIVIYRSRHSPLDLWWMRRYILFVVPLTVLMVAGALAHLRQSIREAPDRAMNALGAALLALTVAQTLAMRPMLEAEVNRDTPARLAEFERDIPDGSFVVVLGGDSLVRGLANTFRSLDDEVVLVDVAPANVDEAVAIAPPSTRLLLVSPNPLKSNAIDRVTLGPELAHGSVEREWLDELREFYEAPDPHEPSEYHVYEVTSST